VSPIAHVVVQNSSFTFSPKLAPTALLSHSIACSPEAGLKISATLVVGAGSVVEAAATLSIVESVDAFDPPHAVIINKAIGTKRLNMMFSA
jgi:hypothetical protein